MDFLQSADYDCELSYRKMEATASPLAPIYEALRNMIEM